MSVFGFIQRKLIEAQKQRRGLLRRLSKRQGPGIASVITTHQRVHIVNAMGKKRTAAGRWAPILSFWSFDPVPKQILKQHFKGYVTNKRGAFKKFLPFTPEGRMQYFEALRAQRKARWAAVMKGAE